MNPGELSGRSENFRTEVAGVPEPPSINPAIRRRRVVPLSAEALWAGLVAGNPQALSQAITLLESQRPDHEQLAQDMVARAMQLGRESVRVGMTGVPGVGKSTLIEALGLCLLDDPARKLAVLTIDPSSLTTGGSILGDKSRMSKLACHPRCFIRPSPSRGALGGVANFTRETMLLCEAAGFNSVIVETVGVGQSEFAVRQMVDLFVLLMLAGAGDELQGIKRGILELADVMVVTKADQNNRAAAELAAQQLRGALPFLRGEAMEVLTVSVLEPETVATLAEQLLGQLSAMASSGQTAGRRADQRVAWMHDLMNHRMQSFLDHRAPPAEVVERVRKGHMTPRQAADLWWNGTGLP